MNDDRNQILNMLASGKISVDEAQQLLESLVQVDDWEISPEFAQSKSSEAAPIQERESGSRKRSRKGSPGSKELIDQVLEMRIHGIDSRFVRGLHEMGFTDLSKKQLKQLGIHKVTPEYIRGIQASGYEAISADELVSFIIHDVSPEYIREMAEAGFDKLSAKEISDLAVHGVSADYVQELSKAGLRDLSVKQLISLSVHDVNAAFLHELVDLGFVDLDSSDGSPIKAVQA